MFEDIFFFFFLLQYVAFVYVMRHCADETYSDTVKNVCGKSCNYSVNGIIINYALSIKHSSGNAKERTCFFDFLFLKLTYQSLSGCLSCLPFYCLRQECGIVVIPVRQNEFLQVGCLIRSNPPAEIRLTTASIHHSWCGCLAGAKWSHL